MFKPDDLCDLYGLLTDGCSKEWSSAIRPTKKQLYLIQAETKDLIEEDCKSLAKDFEKIIDDPELLDVLNSD